MYCFWLDWMELAQDRIRWQVHSDGDNNGVVMCSGPKFREEK